MIEGSDMYPAEPRGYRLPGGGDPSCVLNKEPEERRTLSEADTSKKWRGHMTGEGRGTTKVLGFLGHTSRQRARS